MLYAGLDLSRKRLDVCVLDTASWCGASSCIGRTEWLSLASEQRTTVLTDGATEATRHMLESC